MHVNVLMRSSECWGSELASLYPEASRSGTCWVQHPTQATGNTSKVFISPENAPTNTLPDLSCVINETLKSPRPNIEHSFRSYFTTQ